MDFEITCLTPVDDIPGILERLNKLGKLNYLPNVDKNEARKVCKNSEVIFVNPNQLTFRIDSDFLKDSKIKYVITASTGTNHIDVDLVEVISLTQQMDIIERISSTAEHAFALTLALVRKIPSAFESVKKGNWKWEPFLGRQLNQMNAGIIGYGRLGKIYYKIASSVFKEVFYYDPYVEGGVEIDKIQKECDVISLHVHLNKETQNMINGNFLNKCYKSPYLINTSRGGIVDEFAILESLKNGKLSGYAADVLAGELNSNINSPLINCEENVIITPHIAGMTKEARNIAYNGILDIFENKTYFHK